jgi:hypothetical protein
MEVRIMDELLMKKHFEQDTKILNDNKLLLESRNWKVLKCKYPDFIVSMEHPTTKNSYGFHFICDDYPISLQIVDINNFNLLPNNQWPQEGSFLQNHPLNGRPFLCMPGLREYHTHSSHKNETQWSFPCDKFRLPQLIDRVYSNFLKSRG